jgi:simple sugar transport system ATP-binding protein
MNTATDLTVRMVGITKKFPGVLANDHIDLDLHRSEVHGLLGENGAGKTTLMNILFGLYRPDEGQIIIDGRETLLRSPANAIARGIGMVHQHFRLVRPFTVTENIILGLKEGGALLDLRTAAVRVAAVSEKYGLKVDPFSRIQELSVGEQQRVEILNSLFRGANVLILDEPTAVLTPQEADELAVALREMAKQGKTIVFISHKLDEVFKVTDRVTVVRSGQVVFESLTSETDKKQVAREMIGTDIARLKIGETSTIMALAGAASLNDLRESPSAQIDQPTRAVEVLHVQDLHVRDDRGLPAVRGMGFSVHAGEIVGIAGVDGNGQREMVEAITGLRPIESGQVTVNNEDANRWSSKDFIEHNVAYITDDRQNEGLILNFNVSRNAILKHFAHEPFSRHGLLDMHAIDQFAESLVKTFNIKASGVHASVGTLSGGNQQKLILARELSNNPPLIIANKPTHGLDIGAAANIYQILADERERGAAILLISADLDELLALSNRILVMYEGRVMGELPKGQADPEQIGMLMAGTPL